MLLRSSSTPVLSSLLSSISDSPNNNNTYHETAAAVKRQLPPPSPIHHCSCNKVSFGSVNLLTVSRNSSPISPSVAGFSGGSNKGIRRAQSEGNLEGLAYATSCNSEEDFDNNENTNQSSKKSSGRNKCLTLETIPSFSYSTSRGRREDEDESDEEYHGEDVQDYLEENNKELLQSCLKKEKIMSKRFLEEMKLIGNTWNSDFEGIGGQEMHLAKGLGIGGKGGGRCGGSGGSGGGGGLEFNPSGGDNGDNQKFEEYYKKMVEENPGNPLFLRNYAQFLYKVKRELERAEDYYSRAILADPGDGEVLSQYAMLIWELHHDEDRALSYFERAVHSSPQDSHVHATYAGFLWETEEDEDDDDEGCNGRSDLDSITHRIRRASLASANA